MYGLDQTFPGKCIAFENVEGPGIKCKTAAVSDPESTSNFAGVLVPDGDLLGFNGRLQNRHQSGLIFANRDFLLEVVFEIVAQVFALCFGLLLGGGVEGVDPVAVITCGIDPE